MSHWVNIIGTVIVAFGLICVVVMVIDDHTQEWDDGDFQP